MLEAPIFRCHSTLEETKQTQDHAQLFRLSLSSRTRASFTVSCAGPWRFRFRKLLAQASRRSAARH